MKAPPPTPELCGSTSESIACTAIAASTALPPRFSTLSPACAASGLAAMTNGSAAWLAAIGRAAIAPVNEPAAISAKAKRSLRNTDMPTRLAEEEWRFKSIPLRSRAGGVEFLHGASARAIRKSRFIVPDAGGGERRQTVPLGQARGRMALDQLARGG